MLRFLLTAVLAVAFLLGGAVVPRGSLPAGLSKYVGGDAQAQRRRRRSLMRNLFGRRGVRRRTVKRRSTRRTQRTRRAARQQRAARAARRAARQKRAARQRRAVARQRQARERQRKAARASQRRARERRAARRASLRRQRAKVRRRATRRAAPAAAATAAAPAAEAATPEATNEKAEDPRTILVIGDLYASSTASGLADALEDDPNLSVSKRSNSSSGLVRDDVVNWPKRIAELVEAERPDFIVFQVGANDRQDMTVDGTARAPRAPEWDAEYKSRIAAVAEALKATKVPFLWIGVPPVRFSSMNRDFVVFNEWYAAAAKGAGGRFVDVWDGFTDEGGNYARSGPSVSGQVVTLRGKDGISMTRRGRDKLGWYAEEPVRKALAGTKVYTQLPTIALGSPVVSKLYNPRRTGRTEVVKLAEPKAAEELAGATLVPPEPVQPPPPASVPAGRADDHRWPGR